MIDLKCNCDSNTIVAGNFSCCCKEKTLIQDKLCCNIDLPPDELGGGHVVQPLWETNMNPCCVFASGTFHLSNCSPIGVRLEFRRGNTVLGEQIITPGTCATFTKTRFTSVYLLVDFPGTPFLEHVQGEFCIVPRYAVSC